jgi:hypothetical protein
MKFLWPLLLSLCFVFAKHAAGNGISYYVDAQRGNDKNTGTSVSHPWKSLERINSMQFHAGDRILLKRGSEFSGTLHLKGSGSSANPVRLVAYGNGRRPVIHAATNAYAIQLVNEDHWEISDIETTGGRYAGIFAGITNERDINAIRVANCYVHDVGIDSAGDWDLNNLTGGIVIANGYIKNSKPQLFKSALVNNVTVENCIVRFVRQWTCISISSGASARGKGDKNVIRNCTVEFSVADGIRMNGVKNSAIEYAVMYKNGAWPNLHNLSWGGLGAWFFNADNCVIQYCEAGYIENWHNDGGAFDIDYFQTNSIIQNCYGHDCHGYGVSIFGSDSGTTVNSTIRNNVLRNNARDSAYAYQGDFFLFTWNGGLLNGVNIYNNVSIWNPAAPAFSLKQDADYTGSLPNRFAHNIIYAEDPSLVYAKNEMIRMDSNIYWVQNGQTPVWTTDSVKYHSLEAWQQKTGQEIHSKYRLPDLSSLPEDFQNGQFATSAASLQNAHLPDSLKNDLLLLSFIDFSKPDISQLVFIKSMMRQYGHRGLKTVLVSPGKANRNLLSDLELDAITILKDQNGVYSKNFAVKKFPSTFIILSGTIRKSWSGVALPAPMAFGIEAQLSSSDINLFK